VPYLLAVAMAANIGSVATITGNPQNMMIGSFSGIHYRTFAAALSPVAVAGLVMTVAVIAAIYHREFRLQEKWHSSGAGAHPPCADVEVAGRIRRHDRSFLRWLAGSESGAYGGALLLVTRRLKPERIYREIDWSLLVLFIGLFIVVAGVEKTSLPGDLFRAAQRFHLERGAVLSAFAACFRMS